MKVKIGTSGNLFWALCKIIGEDWDKGKELVENAEKDNDGYIFDIELKIDGVEFDFDSIITGLLERQDEEIEIIENRIEELEQLLDYFDRRDKVCCAIDGEQERYEVETELEQLKEKIY